MSLKVKTYSVEFVILVLVAVSGCLQNHLIQKTTSGSAQANSVKNIPVLVCWYVEDNGAGQHGYAALDGRLNDEPPDGSGLFQSIRQMREKMKLQEAHIKIVVPQFGGELPTGWKIRNLTTNEINAILAR